MTTKEMLEVLQEKAEKKFASDPGKVERIKGYLKEVGAIFDREGA